MKKRKTEFELIAWLRGRLGRGPRTRLGVGDDCAAIDLRPGETCLVTTDALVDGVHFDLRTDAPEKIGRKAIAVSVSDAAAMASRPLAALAAAALPAAGPADLPERLCRGLLDACEEFGVDLVGGDIVSTPGPVTLTTTVLAAAPRRGFVTRAGAKPGDAILVTGELGGSILGRHLTFTPRVREAQALARRFKLHAMMDISDGLSRDLGHILSESGGLGARLEADAIPCSPAARKRAQATGKTPLWHALHDGEDFELLFTLAPRDAERLLKTWRRRPRVSVIGRVVEEPGIWMQESARRLVRVKPEGYEHLR